MTVRTRHRLRAGGAAVALMALWHVPLHADSAIGGYGQPGNALNPSGRMLTLPRDVSGISQLDDITRTPSGLLYALPFVYPELTQSKTNPDWWSIGWIEAGLLGSFGDRTGSASFNKYSDWTNGVFLGSGGFYAENRKTALYVGAEAQNAGRDDQYYQVNTGRYGVFNLTAYFDSIPHKFTTEARSIWDGAGTGNLTLRGGLVAGASTPAQVTAVGLAAPPSELSLTREKAGVSLTYTPWKTIEAVLRLSNEWREGTQPFSATFGYPFENGATQIIQPIHYRTFDVVSALRYKDEDVQANLTYTGSFFNNEQRALTWQNPGLERVAPGAFIPPAGRLSLPPSNSYHNIKGDVAVLVSPALRFTASISYALMRQDDALLPPTVANGIIPGAGGPIDLANWNTTAALSRTRAHAAIDIFNAYAHVQYVASPSLTFDFELRDRNEMNDTNYVAFNPQTGQYGYIAIDGGLAPFIPNRSGVYQPSAPGSSVQIRNMPFANDNLELSGRASYRLSSHAKIELRYKHNSIKHSVREVPDADDNRVRVQFSASGYSWGTVRVSYEYGQLSGSDYTSNPYSGYYSNSLPGYIPASENGDIPFTLDNLRKFDVGDRTEHVVRAQSNFIVSPRTDLQFTTNYRSNGYSAGYGLRNASSYDATAELNYQMSTTATLTGYFTYQLQRRAMANIAATGSTGSAAAGSAAYPLDNAWAERFASNNYTAGVTAHKAWDAVSLDANYLFVRGDSAIRYNYATPGAFLNQLTPAQAGNGFPNIGFTAHALQADLRWQALEHMAYRFIYRVDFQKLDDFHYQRLAPVINNNTYLQIMPENYTVQVLGVAVQYTF